ncbi:hypothetical protein F4802DRAFT_124058 [Xylaria palmicola]|nr:hypothetical protein F4802DRAFT_124058 [Xylaria palmicola]
MYLLYSSFTPFSFCFPFAFHLLSTTCFPSPFPLISLFYINPLPLPFISLSLSYLSHIFAYIHRGRLQPLRSTRHRQLYRSAYS